MDAAIDFAALWAEAVWSYLAMSGVPLLVGFGLAGLIGAFIPAKAIAGQLGGSGRGARFMAVLKASLIGAPMPLCSCSVIPTASSLRKNGAGRGSSAAFAISTPEVDVPSVSLSWVLLGPVFAVVRPVAAVLSAVTAGVLINATETEEPPKAEQSCGCCGCGSKQPASKPTLAARLAEAARIGYLDLPKHLAQWILLGLALSGLVAVSVPEGWLAEAFGVGIGAKLAALLIGIPMYVCATASTPLAAAFIAAGLSPGAAVTFLLAGPATNPATIGWAFKDLGLRAALIYLATIAAVALGTGVLTDAVLAGLIQETMPPLDHAHHHEHGTSAQTLAGIGIALVMLVGLARALGGKLSLPRRRVTTNA